MGLHDLWYQNAIIYCLDVETYADSNGDGVGDFPGLTRRLDYLAGLGVTCLWLLPIFPTPGRDDGYDVSDYCSIDPRLGSMADFNEFMLEAGERGIRVIIDLVANHTSNEHPWFQAARQDPDSPYRDYYVWREDDPGDTSDQVVFPGEQEGIWTFDEVAGAYYLHHFYHFQPDLNFTNQHLRDEFRKIIGLWLHQGVSGFRIDAASFLIKLVGIENAMNLDEAHRFLRDLKNFAEIRKGDSVLLGEVDAALSTIADYFGGGNELQSLFNFPVNRLMFLALAQESADPIHFSFEELPTIPELGQWVNFLRHHDELNLARLTQEQQEQVFSAFGPEPDMQVFGRGIRRRLAPMLGGDQKWLRLAYSVLFSLPGAPLIYYGEEIGMGENLNLDGRMSVRTPMQWTAYGSGSFSSAPVEEWVRPMIMEGEYGCERVNVGNQRSDPESLLNWLAALIRVRKECGEIGAGHWTSQDTGRVEVLGMRYQLEDSTIIILNNLSRTRKTVEIELTDNERSMATDLFTDRQYEPLANDGGKFRIEGFGYRWLRIGGVY